MSKNMKHRPISEIKQDKHESTTFERYSAEVKKFFAERGPELEGAVLATNWDGVTHIAFMSDDMELLGEVHVLVRDFLEKKRSHE